MFRDVSQCFKSVSQCFECFMMFYWWFMMFYWWFMMFYKCFMVFYYVLQCLVSRATIGIAASATADHLWGHDNAAGIGDDVAGIVDIAAKVIPC